MLTITESEGSSKPTMSFGLRHCREERAIPPDVPGRRTQ
jgi:hypothetical protein